MRVVDGSKSSIISIHALLAESDRLASRLGSYSQRFLSTLSLRRATVQIVIVVVHALFLSTLSLRRATAQHFSTLHNIFISIHALLAESDAIQHPKINKLNDFYPRSPCGERQRLQNPVKVEIVFLSTLSLRRATLAPP